MKDLKNLRLTYIVQTPCISISFFVYVLLILQLCCSGLCMHLYTNKFLILLFSYLLYLGCIDRVLSYVGVYYSLEDGFRFSFYSFYYFHLLSSRYVIIIVYPIAKTTLRTTCKSEAHYNNAASFFYSHVLFIDSITELTVGTKVDLYILKRLQSQGLNLPILLLLKYKNGTSPKPS